MHRLFSALLAAAVVLSTQVEVSANWRPPGQVQKLESPEWLVKLPEASRPAVELLWQELDVQQRLKRDAQKQLVSESHRHPISKILESCPGFGPVRAAMSIPVVVTPHRFRTSRQFWSYSGLGIIMRSSSDWVKTNNGWVRAQTAKTRGLSYCFNRTLKYVFKGAATTLITKYPGCPLGQRYHRLLDAGTKPNLAKLTLARAIACGNTRRSTIQHGIKLHSQRSPECVQPAKDAAIRSQLPLWRTRFEGEHPWIAWSIVIR